jgi:FkbM family methyltransferase
MSTSPRPSLFWNITGLVLQALPEFPTKGRWEWKWFPHRDTNRVERRRLSGGAVMDCHLSDYNETWVWMRLLDADQLRVLRQLLRPGETFVDVGAHVGVWALEGGAAVGKTGHVYALEPNPITFARLQHNLDLNRDLTQWHAHERAASSEVGTVTFSIAEMSECCAINDGGANGITVQTVTVDRLLDGAHCHGLKIDVEGHELSVIEGALDTLQRQRPWLCVEFNNTIHHLPALADWPVHQRLTSLGYRCWHFRDAADRAQRPNVSPTYTTKDFVNLFYAAE